MTQKSEPILPREEIVPKVDVMDEIRYGDTNQFEVGFNNCRSQFVKQYDNDNRIENVLIDLYHNSLSVQDVKSFLIRQGKIDQYLKQALAEIRKAVIG